MLYIKDSEGNLKELTVTAATTTDAAKVTYNDGTVDDELKKINDLISAHASNISNPHKVTKEQLGLANVVNTADSATPIEGGLTKFTTGGAYTELNKKLSNTTSTDNAGKAVIVDDNGSLVFGTAGDNISIKDNKISATYSSKAAVENGTETSLVTTGEKYNWNNKQSSVSGMTAATATTAGKAGLVPAPAKGDQAKVLTGSATWTDTVGNASKLKDTAHSWGATELYNELRYTGTSPQNNTSTKVYASAKADEATKLSGFSTQSKEATWGNQKGTVITRFDDSNGGSLAFRQDNPVSGQMSMVIDGTVYVSEGSYAVVDVGSNQSIAGEKTFSGSVIASSRLNIPVKAPTSPVNGDIWIE